MAVEQNNIVGGESASAAASEPMGERVIPENEAREFVNTGDSSQLATERAPSPPRRPVTRSQSGITVPKRRRRDDSPVAKERRVVKPTRKSRTKTTCEAGGVSNSQEPGETEQPAPSTERRVDSTPPDPYRGSPEYSAPLEENSSVPSSGTERKGLRSRAILPVPIPNLTKKSRGRRVPTRDASNDQQEQETRSYVCTAEGCGKCFHRGEHLKRHIRSIHTHEKPFKCTYPMCGKHFNRHDNLLQHLKVHKEPPAEDSEAHLNAFSSSDHTESPPVSPVSNNRPMFRAPTNQPKISSAIYEKTMRYNPYPIPVTYHSVSEPVSFAASIAVSSLRTEIPQSP